MSDLLFSHVADVSCRSALCTEAVSEVAGVHRPLPCISESAMAPLLSRCRLRFVLA